jgi:hypothetical protein
MQREDECSILKDRLRQVLIDQARATTLITYRELAERLVLTPPHTVHRVTQALEALMAEDVAAGRPLLAVLCVSRLQKQLPAPGFFMTAKALEIFTGDAASPEARSFYEKELQRTLAYYRQP